MTFRGLTWDHPRGRDALREAARRVNQGRAAPLIEWAVQPLEGFESAPIADLADRHDLLVLDHPHIGEAVAEDCLQPLDELFEPDLLARWARDTVGPAFRSYVWSGLVWGMPLDVATQVTVRRPDHLPEPPASWAEVEAVARRFPTTLSVAGPHAILSLLSIAAGQGTEARGPDLLSDEAFLAAWEVMRQLWALRVHGAEALNPIGLSEAMARGDLALVPLLFGYVTYARPAEGQAPLAFSDVIGGRGGVLGGTGIGVTRRCLPSPELLDHLAFLLSRAAQVELLPTFGGQPSARAAWKDDGVNADWGGFYAGTLATADRAYLRPRFDGYIAFQRAASDRLRQALASRESDIATLAALRSLWTAARARARGDLDDRRET